MNLVERVKQKWGVHEHAGSVRGRRSMAKMVETYRTHTGVTVVIKDGYASASTKRTAKRRNKKYKTNSKTITKRALNENSTVGTFCKKCERPRTIFSDHRCQDCWALDAMTWHWTGQRAKIV